MLRFHTLSIFILALAGLIYSCASSDRQQSSDHNFPNQVTLQKPESAAYEEGKVYIDSVSHATVNDQKALLISGSFSDGCTQLQEVTHEVTNDSLTIQLSAWRNTDSMCTQALVPFSYLYEQLPPEQVASYSTVTINGKIHSF